MTDRTDEQEIAILRKVASAAKWVIESNGDDPVGRDGRSRVGINWIMANGALNSTLRDLTQAFPIEDHFQEKRQEARSYQEELEALRPKKKRKGAPVDKTSV